MHFIDVITRFMLIGGCIFIFIFFITAGIYQLVKYIKKQ